MAQCPKQIPLPTCNADTRASGKDVLPPFLPAATGIQDLQVETLPAISPPSASNQPAISPQSNKCEWKIQETKDGKGNFRFCTPMLVQGLQWASLKYFHFSLTLSSDLFSFCAIACQPHRFAGDFMCLNDVISSSDIFRPHTVSGASGASGGCEASAPPSGCCARDCKAERFKGFVVPSFFFPLGGTCLPDSSGTRFSHPLKPSLQALEFHRLSHLWMPWLAICSPDQSRKLSLEQAFRRRRQYPWNREPLSCVRRSCHHDWGQNGRGR